MRKNHVILPLILTSFFLTGCPQNYYEVTHLDYGSYIDTSLRVINHSELDKLISSESSFVIAVSPATKGCACWNTFKQILQNYVKTEHVIIYEINYDSFFTTSGQQMDSYGITIHKDEETFAIFNKGKLARQDVYNANNSIFKVTMDFNSYMEKYVIKPNMYYVGLDNLEQIRTKAASEKAVVYFARNNCPDCQYVESNFLNTYDFKNYRMYIVDCESLGIREYALDDEGNPTMSLTPESQVAWQTFKDDYGLSNKYNETYGFDTGYVPTFQLVSGGGENYRDGIISASVYFNDSYEKEDDHYVVTKSFYSEERKSHLSYLEGEENAIIQGITFTEEEMEEVTYGEFTFKTWSKSYMAKRHNPLLKKFLDYALEKTTIELE